ncbi:alanine dehydrogenase [Desulfonatronum thiosulfatophilum]|uniref:Saccharopine dehydrogenase [NAD(+), L-lysine-forming] n=1 Tax=Desulfonatronum thiosulfatophilum TaxID=617002 RepID=A0A1G6BZG2_9BACT|nr:NAD(P)-dependent oxidoreductase [Desulfonatronum thiosulfatophilum]SDB26019.1 alanine dehydrogenase [Desulfonatronum thiosulfatophilum]
MRIGIPKEIKPQEGRIALLPRQVERLVQAGHRVFVESGAGRISRSEDREYEQAGAAILSGPAEVFAAAELIVKVKEILPPEYPLLRGEHIILTNIHAAMNREQLDTFLQVGLTAISAENTHRFGSPNCVLAGEVGALEAVRLCLACYGGTGRHFMGHFGESALKVLVLGLGNVGRGAVRTLLGLGATVIGLDVFEGARKAAALDWHDRRMIVGEIDELSNYLEDVDAVVNCVLWPKERTDHLIPREMLGRFKPGAVIVDISCDQGGAVETCRPTSWAEPVYEVDGVRHFCVDNIPGAVPVTASAGYGEALMDKILAIAAKGVVQACKDDPWLARGLTCAGGTLLLEEAARYQKREFTTVQEWLESR